jgi:hypothetical protein
MFLINRTGWDRLNQHRQILSLITFRTIDVGANQAEMVFIVVNLHNFRLIRPYQTIVKN